MATREGIPVCVAACAAAQERHQIPAVSLRARQANTDLPGSTAESSPDRLPVRSEICVESVWPVGGGPRCEIRLPLLDAQLYFYTVLASNVIETKVLCLIDRKVAFISKS